jgi:hypothetical protein
MKNEVAGVAGAARIDNLDRAGLARAEKHGKRLDQTGRSRAINDEPPVTTTGLDLRKLFDRHIEGAFIPKAKSSAMHLLIRFPTDLVDGADADYMLHHARAFAERVFGDEAIFADRVDRDETSQRVVDLFLAPRYIKTTKRESKPAVSTTHHLKLLAAKHGETPLPYGYGRALQTALFEYMRDEMKLDGVERGKAKVVPGKDWKSSEQQRVEELDEQQAAVERRARILDDQEKTLATAREDIAHREAILTEREQQNADVARQLAAQRADADARDLEDSVTRAAIAAELATAERSRQDAAHAAKIARDEADRLMVEQRQATAAAAAARDAAIQHAGMARREREEVELERARIANAEAELARERDEVEQERQLHDRQLALLERAADEDSELRLRAGSYRMDDLDFVMDEKPMTPREWASYVAPWHPMIAAIARRLARALDAVRQVAASLRDREITVTAREAALEAKRAQADQELAVRRAAQKEEHQAAMAVLDARRAGLDLAQAEANRLLENATTREAAAVTKEKEADNLIMSHERWATALKAIGETPDMIVIDNQGTASINAAVARTFGSEFAATFQLPPPEWAGQALTAQLELAEKTYSANQRARQAEYAQDRLEELIVGAGAVMTPAQEAFASSARQVSTGVTPWRRGHDGVER